MPPCPPPLMRYLLSRRRRLRCRQPRYAAADAEMLTLLPRFDYAILMLRALIATL